MKQVKKYEIEIMPTANEIAEALLIAKHQKCIIDLRWFNPFPIGKMGDNYLRITEDMTYEECVKKLGFQPVRRV